jgi:aminoglycoside phosphotransferase (APT) family kinase protein
MPEPLPTTLSAALHAVGNQLSIDTAQAQPLRLHDAATFLLPAQHLVVRLVPASEETLARATKAIHLTRWLSEQGFPTVRAAIPDPIPLTGHVATVWHHVPPQPAADILVADAALGRLIRELHALPDPPFPVPGADPLARMRTALAQDAERPRPLLNDGEREFLHHRIGELAEQYEATHFPLGQGLIHNDAHPGNLLADPANAHGFVLSDWEGAAIGPREMDVVLVGAPGSRFGDTEEERIAFSTAYGYDVASWPGYKLLRDVRDLHSLAAHLRAGPRKPAVLVELRSRIASLRDDDRSVRWNAV